MTPPPKQFTGDDPLVDPLNRMLKNQVENTPLDSEDIIWDRGPKGAKPKLRKDPIESAGNGENFLIVRKYKDYTVGQRWTADLAADIRGIQGNAQDSEVRIAKPFEIRTSFWDAIALGGVGTTSSHIDGYQYAFSEPDGDERIATLLDASEFGAATIGFEQEIFPKYILNKTIICAQKVKQGAIMRVEEDGQTYTVDYVENQGRFFRNKPRKIRVCIEGQSGPWFALFYPSAAFREE